MRYWVITMRWWMIFSHVEIEFNLFISWFQLFVMMLYLSWCHKKLVCQNFNMCNNYDILCQLISIVFCQFGLLCHNWLFMLQLWDFLTFVLILTYVVIVFLSIWTWYIIIITVSLIIMTLSHNINLWFWLINSKLAKTIMTYMS